MKDPASRTPHAQSLNGKWLVIIIIAAGIISAIVGARYTKYKAMSDDATTEPANH